MHVRDHAEITAASASVNSLREAMEATLDVTNRPHDGQRRSRADGRGHNFDVGDIYWQEEEQELQENSFGWNESCLDFYPVLVFQLRKNTAAK